MNSLPQAGDPVSVLRPAGTIETGTIESVMPRDDAPFGDVVIRQDNSSFSLPSTFVLPNGSKGWRCLRA